MYTDVSLGRVTELNGVLLGTTQGFQRGAIAAEADAKAMGRYAKEVGTATGETDDLGNAIYELPDGKQVVIDAKTDQAYEDIDAIEKKKLSDKSTTVKVHVDDSNWRYWQPNPKTGQINARVTGTTWQ